MGFGSYTKISNIHFAVAVVVVVVVVGDDILTLDDRLSSE